MDLRSHKRSYRTRMEVKLVGLFVVLSSLFLSVHGIYFQGSPQNSYAKFPPWNACVNASISFEFQTTQEEGVLMYVDDGGRYDFFVVEHRSGTVVLQLNIVDGQEGRVEIRVGNNVNNGQWHRVEIRRNRMETTLLVDGSPSSKFSFGSDFYFGDPSSRQPVYFGGLPSYFSTNLRELALPSTVYQPRFKGSIRNILYSNCTCETRRVQMEQSEGVNNFPMEACDQSNQCQRGCLCISEDNKHRCECSQAECVTGAITHYKVPFDRILDTTIINPSGMDATAFGSVQLVDGVRGQAVRLDGKDSYIRIAGPGHRFECFGDLDKCPLGYTLAFWVNFQNPCDRQFVYMSNGGHDENSHGVAMLYDRGNIEFRFLRKSGAEWRVSDNNLLPSRWYHVTVSWSLNDGLSLYIDGNLVDTDISPNVRSRSGTRTQYNEFFLGRPNDDSPVTEACVMEVDGFEFWAKQKGPGEITGQGPLYCYHLPMDSSRNNEIQGTNIRATLHGNPEFQQGKVGRALALDGQNDYVDAGEQSNACLGDLTLCQHGVTISMWWYFSSLQDNTYFFSTGGKGLEFFYRDRKLIVEAQQRTKSWRVTFENPEIGRWYFVEFTWDELKGLKLYLDLTEVAAATDFVNRIATSSGGHLFLGRANTDMTREKYAKGVVDQVDICYGDRLRLINLGYILRGRPQVIFVSMDVQDGTAIVHKDLDITLFGNPKVVPGKVEGALQLDGTRQYASLGSHDDSCLGNLDLCANGLLMAAWINPGTFRNKGIYLDTGNNGFKAWYEGNKFKVTADTSTRTWEVETSALEKDVWQFVEFSWHPETGLALYINNNRVANSTTSRVRSDTGQTTRQGQFYIGRQAGAMAGKRYANFTIDDLQYWFGDRNYLHAHGYIQRGRPEHMYFDMDRIVNNRLRHPTMYIPVYGGPFNTPGVVNNSVMMNGNNQYIDIGQHYDKCVGNLEHCPHGITGSMWMNFHNMENDMYYYSTGDSVNIFHRNGNIHFMCKQPGKEWEVIIPDISQHEWHFFEYTWHPDKGLRVYVNNKLVGHAADFKDVPVKDSQGASHVYFGRANGIDTGTGRPGYADFSVDEAEIWYADRDYLIAFNYILRGEVDHMFIPLEVQRGNKCLHPELNITLYNGAGIQDGIIGNAAWMNGNNQYMTLGDHSRTCMGNLDKCDHGMTMTFHMNPREFVENGYFMSSGPYHIYYKDGRVHFKYSTSTKTWEVSTGQITLNEWQKIDVSWDPERGLQIYRDDQLIGHTTYYEEHDPLHISDWNIYVGKANPTIEGGQSTNVMIDEIEYWYANRDYLWSHGILTHDVDRLIIDMEEVDGILLNHPERLIYARGRPTNVPGCIDRAVYLNGNQQFLDLGRKVGICKDNLDFCYKGYTTRLRIKPEELRDNMWFVSSAPLDVYYKGGRLIAEYRTPRKQWTISSSELAPHIWNLVDLSWHPVDGAKMFINGKRVDYQMTGSIFSGDYDTRRQFYIGRTDTEMRNELYPDAALDDFRMYNGRWEYLHWRNILDFDFCDVTVPTQPPQPSDRYDPCREDKVLHNGQKKWLVFDGRSWITYEVKDFMESYLSGSTREEIHIKFQTSSPDGLLWYVGNDEKNAHLTLKSGILVLMIDYERGYRVDRFRIRPQTQINDGAWHSVLVKRESRNIRVMFDGLEMPYTLSDEATFFHPDALFHVGGHSNVYELTDGDQTRMFTGIIEEIFYYSNNVPCDLDWVDMFIRNPGYVDEGGDVIIRDPVEIQPPISFTNNGAYVRLPMWDARRYGSLEFNFKTVEPNTMLMYNGGQPGLSDFVSIEMFDGIPYFVIDTGYGEHRYEFSRPKIRVDDGEDHYIKVDRTGQNLRLTLDDQTIDYDIGGRNLDLDLGTFMFMGAPDNPHRLPWHMWTRKNKFYQGTMWGLKVNEADIDLIRYIKEQNMIGVQEGDMDMPNQCENNPCVHGMCYERFTGFFCDCSDTSYTGHSCEQKAPVATFNGTQYAGFAIRPQYQTHTNDISVRFKTHRPDGLLFDTENSLTNEYLKAYLQNGRGRIETNLGGQARVFQMVFECENEVLNDDEWHTLHLNRRANYFETWVDDCKHAIATLPGEGYSLDIDKVYLGGSADDADQKFTGHVQNFYFDDFKFIEYLPPGIPPDNITIFPPITTNPTPLPLPIFPITYRSKDYTYVALPKLEVFGNLDLKFMFKTREKDGLLFYNDGEDNDFLAIELVNGLLHFSVDDGSGSTTQVANSGSLDDNKWHMVHIKQISPHSFEIIVDGVPSIINLRRTTNRIDLTGMLYVGGVREDVAQDLPIFINSRRSFVGCLATLKVNGVLKNIYQDALDKSTETLATGCIDTRFCTPGICKHFGKCTEGLTDYICDCSLTSYVGKQCDQESEGYRFGRDGGRGIGIYRIFPPANTDIDRLAFGFMTWKPNGTLVRIDSKDSQDFIEAKLEKGYVVVTYDIGDGVRRLEENSRLFNNGQYHYVTFIRNGKDATLRVDEYDARIFESTTGNNVRLFDQMNLAKIGGNLDHQDNIIDYFDGIIAGVYLNGWRIIDLGHNEGDVKETGDIHIAEHPFYVPKPKVTVEPPTEKPGTPSPTKPPVPIPDKVPPGAIGGGIAWTGVGPNGEAVPPGVYGGGGDGEIPVGGIAIGVDPGGGGVGVSGGVEGPISIGQVGAPPADVAQGARAAAVAGTMIGLLVAASGLMWAVYKFKPGLFGAGGGGGSSALKISSPRSAVNYQLVSQNAKGGGGFGGGAGGGSTTVVNGGAGFGLGLAKAHVTTQTTAAGAATADFSQYVSAQTNSNINLAGSGIAGLIAGHGVVTRGTQSDLVYAGYGKNRQHMSEKITTTTTVFESQQGDAATATQTISSAPMAYEVQTQTLPMHGDGYFDDSTVTTTIKETRYVEGARTMSPPPGDMNTLASSYQMQNMAWQDQANTGALSSGIITLAAESIRVDSCQISKNGRHVITSSLLGPPQVWDMRNGELVRNMAGEDFSSTDLHLACNDTLLVGQVAELTQIDPNDFDAANRLHQRKLQIWDFATGQPLDMPSTELCTASCMMADNERVVLGRTDKFGNGTTIVIWDLMGNQALRRLKYDGAIGFADYISYLNLSTDNRYVVAGFQNSYDGKANFIIFDLTLDNHQEPKVLAIDAVTEVTAVLGNHEVVTGTRSGELSIWSMRTGKQLRQFVTPPSGAQTLAFGGMAQAGPAHKKEVMAVAVSMDRQYLVSASADNTLKVWNTESEKPMYTLRGHTDEVWCCAIAGDNEFIVSGSLDNTIRLWRLKDGMPICLFNCGMDIFSVKISDNKKTIVALGDREKSRKLIMLQIVRTKTRSRAPSRATSPLHAEPYPQY